MLTDPYDWFCFNNVQKHLNICLRNQNYMAYDMFLLSSLRVSEKKNGILRVSAKFIRNVNFGDILSCTDISWLMQDKQYLWPSQLLPNYLAKIKKYCLINVAFSLNWTKLVKHASVDSLLHCQGEG